MNDNRVYQLFDKYIEKFEEINTKHEEYYKWQIAKAFKPAMDDALNASTDDFASKLKDVRKLSANLIDSYTSPFNGLCVFAKEEPDSVRQMFKDLLYTDDDGDIEARRVRIVDFLRRSHALREKYSPDSFLYKDDYHSVTGYMFLYDPDHNYLFKASHASKFADCVEYFDDWGSGDDIKLDVYYRMCDQLVDHINHYDALLKTNESRFAEGFVADVGSMYPDHAKHILAFDLIYCCSTYNLFDGISFIRPKSSEKHLILERKEKAEELYEKMLEAKENEKLLLEAKSFVDAKYVEGTCLIHKKYGEGIVRRSDKGIVIVDFPEIGEKKLGLYQSVATGIIRIDKKTYTEQLEKYIDYLKKESSIKTAVSYSEKQFQPYAEYLD